MTLRDRPRFFAVNDLKFTSNKADYKEWRTQGLNLENACMNNFDDKFHGFDPILKVSNQFWWLCDAIAKNIAHIAIFYYICV